MLGGADTLSILNDSAWPYDQSWLVWYFCSNYHFRGVSCSCSSATHQVKTLVPTLKVHVLISDKQEGQRFDKVGQEYSEDKAKGTPVYYA